MSDIVKFSEKLPRALPEEQIHRDAKAFIDSYYRASNEKRAAGVTHNQHLLATIETMLPDAEKHLARVEKLSAPAEKVQIAKHLALLLKSFPNAGKDNAEIFGRMLCEDVGAQAPTISGLEAACRQLRRNCLFIPTIAEVLTALTEVEEHQRKVISMLAGLPEHRQRLAARVQDDIKRQAEWDCGERQEKEQMLRRQRAGEINADIDLPF